MGTYLPVPAGQPKAAWLAAAGAAPLQGPPAWEAVPAGTMLVAVVTLATRTGDAALLVTTELDYRDTLATPRPVAWLLISTELADALLDGA